MTTHEAEHDQEGNATKGVLSIIVGTGVLGVLAAGMVNVANDASIALRVAEQHGQEILLIRGSLDSLRVEMLERTQSRYTSSDAMKDLRYIEERLARLESDIESCCRGR